MGSYISIVNDTDVMWTCKVGPDEMALKIAGIIVAVLSTAATAVATAGAAAPLATALASKGVISVFGVPTATLVTATTAATSTAATVASIAGGASTFSIAVATGVNSALKSKGYVDIAPGEKHRYGKMSLSLWQQGTCVRTIIVDETTVKTDTVYMRPIFSGATDNSNNDHEIKYWLDKDGTESEEVQGTSAMQARGRELGYNRDAQLIYFYPNGTNTYVEEDDDD